LATAANTVRTTAYVTRSGRLVAFVFGNSANAPNPITAVNSLPTFTKNGSPISCLGPFWDMATLTDPFLFFQLPSQVLNTDVIAFAASAGWVTTTAGSATVYQSGVTANFTGIFEAPLFGYVPFDYLPANTSGMQAAMGGGYILEGFSSIASVAQNWFHRGSWINPGGTIGSSTADGRPITISAATGAAKIQIADNNTDNAVDALCYPDLVGTWTLVADDTSGNPATAMLAGIRLNSAAATVTSGPVTPAKPTTAGTLVGGVLVGQTWQWTIAFNGSPSVLDIGLVLTIQTPTGAAGNYTLTNEWMFPPNGAGGGAPPLSRGNLAQADPNFLSWLKTGKKGPACLRQVLGGYDGGQSNMVNVADFHATSDLLWSANKTTNTANITSIRAYSLTNSPNIYFASGYTGTTVNSGGSGALAYQYAPATPNFPLWLGLGWFIAECVCSASHGLYSGQLVTLAGATPQSAMPTISTTQGQGTPINFQFPAGLYNQPIFVTGATTFIIWGYNGASTQGTLPINTVATTYSVPGGSPFYASVSLPDLGVPPHEIMAQAAASLPGCAGLASVPLIASDAAVAHIASIYLSYLPPGRLCYVEVGNEAWNNNFWQGPVFNAALIEMAGSPFSALSFGTDIVLRAMQVANIFRTVWGASGRASSIRSMCNVQAVSPGSTQTIVSPLNTYNAAHPSAPFQLDAIAVAPYLSVSTDQQPNPQSQATVNATGGGSGGGSLKAGIYIASYTYVDALTGYESNVGVSQSAPFAVAAGNIPTVTFNDTLPSTASGRNLYLTPFGPLFSRLARSDSAVVGGAAGGRMLAGSLGRRRGGIAGYTTGAGCAASVQYATGLTASTSNLSAAAPSTPTQPPTDSLAPSYVWAAASIATGKPGSITNSAVNPGNPYAANPWTYDSWGDYLRHFTKYNTLYDGPSGGLVGHVNYLAGYTKVNGQNPPILMTYEGILQTFVSHLVQHNAPAGGSPPGLPGQLTHDIYYHPSQYYVHLAYLQMLQQNGVGMMVSTALAGPRQLFASIAAMYGHVVWAGQKPGRGDNSDGKGTNLLWINTGQAQDLVNVSPRLQAWQDWAGAGNAAPEGLLVPIGRSPMIRSAATHGWHGFVMTRAKLVPASPHSAKKRWFPGMSRIRRTF